MKIETKYNVGDKVVFDENRVGEIVGFEIHSTMKELGYKKPSYPQYANNTEVRYQIKPIDQKGYLYGSMREESTLTLIKDKAITTMVKTIKIWNNRKNCTEYLNRLRPTRFTEDIVYCLKMDDAEAKRASEWLNFIGINHEVIEVEGNH